MSALNLNPYFREKIRKSIKKHSHLSERGGTGCIIWTGTVDKEGYPVKRVTWPNKKSSLCRVQRLVMMVKTGHLLAEMDDDGETVEVSHLCHYRDCVNVEHLTLETHWINLGRRQCVAAGRCLGHQPPCIF